MSKVAVTKEHRQDAAGYNYTSPFSGNVRDWIENGDKAHPDSLAGIDRDVIDMARWLAERDERVWCDVKAGFDQQNARVEKARKTLAAVGVDISSLTIEDATTAVIEYLNSIANFNAKEVKKFQALSDQLTESVKGLEAQLQSTKLFLAETVIDRDGARLVANDLQGVLERIEKEKTTIEKERDVYKMYEESYKIVNKIVDERDQACVERDSMAEALTWLANSVMKAIDGVDSKPLNSAYIVDHVINVVKQRDEARAERDVAVHSRNVIVNERDTARAERDAALVERDRARRSRDTAEVGLIQSATAPVPLLLWCPSCCTRHVDVGDFATKPHHTHACQHCGMVWRPAIINTVGVDFLPGFKDPPPPNPDGIRLCMCSPPRLFDGSPPRCKTCGGAP